jgi:hypothetical protein
MTAGAFNFPSTAQRTQCCATENPVSMARQKVEIETEVAHFLSALWNVRACAGQEKSWHILMPVERRKRSDFFFCNASPHFTYIPCSLLSHTEAQRTRIAGNSRAAREEILGKCGCARLAARVAVCQVPSSA